MIIGNKVIDKCPPAPLHVCKTGPFNHMIKNLAKLCPKVVLEFVSEINVSSEKYHGGDYEGNEVEKCFRNLDLLENKLDANYTDYVETFKSLSRFAVSINSVNTICIFSNRIHSNR